jgi:hypothetical protein
MFKNRFTIILFPIILLIGLVFTQSCEEETFQEFDNFSLFIYFTPSGNDGSYTVSTSTAHIVECNVLVRGNGGYFETGVITKIRLRRDGAAVDSIENNVVLDGTGLFLGLFTITSSATVNSELITVDAYGTVNGVEISNSRSFTLITTASPVNANAFNLEEQGQFYHKETGGIPTLDHAWNFTSDLGLNIDDSDFEKDMMSTDDFGASFTGSFESFTGTEFVLDNGYDYGIGDSDAAIAAYAAGEPSDYIVSPDVGNIYIVDIGGQGVYAALKITAIDPTDDACFCTSEGSISFTYKKN